jgi:hypothetical protein
MVISTTAYATPPSTIPCLSVLRHRAKGSIHIDCGITSFQNKESSVITSAIEGSSMEAPTPNMLLSFFQFEHMFHHMVVQLLQQ